MAEAPFPVGPKGPSNHPLGAEDFYTGKSGVYFDGLRTGLRKKLLFVYITPFVVLSVYIFFQQYRTLRDAVDYHLISIAENKRNTVDLYLSERISNVRNLFFSPHLAAPSSSASLDESLAALKRESATFVELALFDKEGTLVSYAGPIPSLKGLSYKEAFWFRRLGESNKDYFLSDVFLGVRNEPHFIIAVKRTVSKETWTLRAVLDPARFGEFVDAISVVADVETESFVLNGNGERQTLSQKSSGVSGQGSALSTAEGEGTVDEAMNGKHQYARAVAPLTAVDWHLVVQVSKASAYRPLFRALVIFGIAGMIALALIVIVVFRQTATIVDRLRQEDVEKAFLARRLFHAAKLASIGEMAAGVAHEINNPLAVIHEETEMIKDLLNPELNDSFSSDDAKERLGAIIEAVFRGRDVAAKLLTFARQGETKTTTFDLNRETERALSINETRFKKLGITIERHFGNDLPHVKIGEGELLQVVLNLISNAADAMPEGGILSVITRQTDGFATLEIGDTGVGMSEEVMEKAFFPFFTTKGVGKGTGLGLSICYGIVKAARGSIELVGGPGRGTTVRVLLPGVKNEAREENSLDLHMPKAQP